VLSFQGIAEAYRNKYPAGTATVTQFQPRPQLLVRKDRTHRAESLTFAEAIYSPDLPPPTKESIRYSCHLHFHAIFRVGRLHEFKYCLTSATLTIIL
jgi:hypothetical protein